MFLLHITGIRTYGVKWPCGYDEYQSQGDNFIQVDFDTPWCQPESDVIAD
ncbi:putative aerotaxis sensor receptor, flavoprotein [Escherichia coli P0304777.2]|nr:putative aerotaxis sensor receptor, flavoprotein [Escherichia coli P0304777.2]ENF07779.1 putative aerotaxis sensor receptor, flavoprotein [Escherichia coli P0304777.9]